MKTCEKCGGDLSWTNDLVKLRGGATAHLCVVCLREWNEMCSDFFAVEDDKVIAMEQHLNGRALAQDAPTESDFLEVAKKRRAIDDKVRAMAREFLAVKVSSTR